MSCHCNSEILLLQKSRSRETDNGFYWKNCKDVYEEAAQYLLIRAQRHNFRTPRILQLPDELLSVIFQFSIDDGQLPSPSIASLLKLTWVCQRWRNAALNSPQLWNTPDFRSRESVIREVLARSKSTRLFIECNISQLGLVVPVIGRVASLHLNSLPNHISWVDTNRPASVLRRLMLDGGKSHLRVPPDFLGGSAPNLRYVIAHEASLPWSSPLLTNLVKLTLSQGAQDSYESSTVEFVAALRSMPLLETLVVRHAFPDIKDPKSTLVPTRLSHLRTLRLISSSKPHLANALGCLMFPTDFVTVTIKYEDPFADLGTSSVEDDPDCAVLAKQVNNTYTGATFRRMVYSPKGEPFITLYPHSHVQTPNTEAGVLNMRFTDNGASLYWFMKAFTMPSSLTTLEIRGNGPGRTDFVHFFGSLPYLETVIVFQNDPAALLLALISSTRDNQYLLHPPPLCVNDGERCDCVSPEQVAFSSVRNVVPRGIPLDRTLLEQTLPHCMIQRFRHRVGIDTLWLDGCTGLNTRDIERLRNAKVHLVATAGYTVAD